MLSILCRYIDVESITFINNTKGSHEKLILELIQDAEEIHFASGFFRESGYDIKVPLNNGNKLVNRLTESKVNYNIKEGNR